MSETTAKFGLYFGDENNPKTYHETCETMPNLTFSLVTMAAFDSVIRRLKDHNAVAYVVFGEDNEKCFADITAKRYRPQLDVWSFDHTSRVMLNGYDEPNILANIVGLINAWIDNVDDHDFIDDVRSQAACFSLLFHISYSTNLLDHGVDHIDIKYGYHTVAKVGLSDPAWRSQLMSVVDNYAAKNALNVLNNKIFEGEYDVSMKFLDDGASFEVPYFLRWQFAKSQLKEGASEAEIAYTANLLTSVPTTAANLKLLMQLLKSNYHKEKDN